MAPQIKKPLAQALKSCRSSFLMVGFFSMCINLLMLVPSIYMLQVYDRVITSGSEVTLLMITLIMTLMLVTIGVLEWVRSRILVRVSNNLDMQLNQKVFNTSFKRALYTGNNGNSSQSLQDLTGLRQFMTGNGLFAFFDAPWIPIYLFVMFAFHAWFGWIAVASALLLSVLAVINEYATRGGLQKANEEVTIANLSIRQTMANAEVIQSMGMLDNLRHNWLETQYKVLSWQTNASERACIITPISKTLRMLIQSLILGVGAYLAINNQITPGLMIAGSILLGRALAPIDQMIGAWKGFIAARGQYSRLSKALEGAPEQDQSMSLPKPQGNIVLDGVVMAPPGSRVPTLKGISFSVSAGEVIGVLGPSAAGKSTLARGLLGIWPTMNGKVRLDGADIFAWNRTELGPSIGYLPQDIELFAGSVSENIARFGEIDAQKVVAAAQESGVHELVLGLSDGYDTVIGAQGANLSAGQRQRIGLARALYDQPNLIVLDEPNSNLDERGEMALAHAIHGLKARGATVFIITHRPNILAVVDKLIVLNAGVLQGFGPRDEVLASLKKNTKAIA